MEKSAEKLPLDARLLCNAIIELNIARRIISLYPGNHDLVHKALDRTYDTLQNLFEFRREITLSVAKDTLIIDEHYLDRKNPVFREFALSLSRLRVACLTFVKGVTKEEVYSLHRFLSRDPAGLTAATMAESLKEYELRHIQVTPLDFGGFSFQEGTSERHGADDQILAHYIRGLLDGTLIPEEAEGFVGTISPEELARLMNQAGGVEAKEEAYDTVISSYLRSSSGHVFTGKELGRLMAFLNGLQPGLKRQFLTSSVKSFNRHLPELRKALEDVSVDRIIAMLAGINEQCISLPDPLRNLLNKFAQFGPVGFEEAAAGFSNVADDILLSPDIANLLSDKAEDVANPESYRAELLSLIDADHSKHPEGVRHLFEAEWGADWLRYCFCQALMEIISAPQTDLVTAVEYTLYADLFTRIADQLVDEGQFSQLHELLRQLEANVRGHVHPALAGEVLEHCQSAEFLSRFVAALASYGRRERVSAMLMCDTYGEKIASPLLDLLGSETSRSVRRFVITLLVHLGDKAAPATLARLRDKQWFVRRNMLCILGQVAPETYVGSIRPFCRDSDLRVRIEAVKCLVQAKDQRGAAALREMVLSEDRGEAQAAVTLAGLLRTRELQPDLVRILRRKAARGGDFEQKIPVARALGRIGGAEAEQPLREILDAQSLLFRKDLERLKAEARLALKRIEESKA